MARRKSVKVALKSSEGELETVWCTVVNAKKGLFRVDNIPVLTVRPMYGDVIVATLGREGLLTYRRTQKRGGYWLDVLEYKRKATFKPLVTFLRDTFGIVCEGISGPTAGEAGIVSIAAPKGVAYSDLREAIARRFRDVRPVPSEEEELSWALHAAVVNGDVKAMRKRIAEGASADATNEQGVPAVAAAAERGDASMLRALRAVGANLQIRNGLGHTGLHFAAGEGHAPVVKVFLDAGVSPNDGRNQHRATPLHFAAAHDQPGVAKLLLKAGARLDLRDGDDFTPLMRAVVESSAKTARVLLPHCSAKQKDEALRLAVRRKRAPIVRLLQGVKGTSSATTRRM